MPPSHRATPVRAPHGAPHRDPANPVDRSPRAPGSTPADTKDDHLPLPHERDQSTQSTAPAPDPNMRQANKDLQAGQVDTDMHATPGLDAQRREAYVPGAGGQAPSQRTRAPVPPAPRKGPRP